MRPCGASGGWRQVALRKESVDRNRAVLREHGKSLWSLSARRAWIEIRPPTPLTAWWAKVALRKESVDRNVFLTLTVRNVPVALRKESVDRNLPFWSLSRCRIRSLSARRAWIEISMSYNAAKFWGSLSARRAWIEITVAAHVGRRKLSLSARRAWIEMRKPENQKSYKKCRSPQGERG